MMSASIFCRRGLCCINRVAKHGADAKRQGWLGIAPTGQKITLRSLDFWRLENGFIRENWVLIDLLDVWAQTIVDVMARMQHLRCTSHFPQNEKAR